MSIAVFSAYNYCQMLSFYVLLHVLIRLKFTSYGSTKKDGSFDLRFKGGREAQAVADENVRKGKGCLFVLILIGVLIWYLVEEGF